MGKYTLTIQEILANNVNLFDFDYSFYNESHKKGFEKKFVDRFLFDEIGAETVARFKHNLRTTLNEIMPYYTHLYETSIYEYNPILNYDLQEVIIRDVSNEQEEEGTITDSNKNYEPDNCQWITQAKNSSKSLKRKITPEIFENVLILKNQGMSGSQIARLYKVYPSCINKRLKQIKTKE